MTELWDILDENGNKTGRLHERGKPIQKGDYNLGVHVWIINKKGEFLISRRSIEKGHKWHTTGGMAVAGDDSLTTALKEAKEEIGITLDPEKSHFIKRFSWPVDEGGHFLDAWLFRQEIDINDVVLQEEEVCDVMWASVKQIRQMIEQNLFVDALDWYPYLEELFSFCEKQ